MPNPPIDAGARGEPTPAREEITFSGTAEEFLAHLDSLQGEEKICEECGNDLVREGYKYCSECLELLGKDADA